jgi:hypothetical protein
MTTPFSRATRLFTLSAALSGALILSACGGGSSNDEAAATPAPANPTPTSPTTPTPTPTPTTPGMGTSTTPSPTPTTTTPTPTTPAPTATTPAPTPTTPTTTPTTPSPTTPTTPVAVNHNTQPALEAATQVMADFDQLANTIPTVANATTYLSNTDSCYLLDGRTKAINTANIDADLNAWRERNKFLIGVRRSNIQVTSDQVTNNPDGSTRRQISISYRTSYADGIVNDNQTISFISGSSQGICATPTNSTEWRFLGNQRVAGVTVRPRNELRQNFSLANGSEISTTQRREIQMLVTDPGNAADYAIVTAPVSIRLGTTTAPLSYKLISPRLTKSAPELQGKRGNVVNVPDDDAYQICAGNLNGSLAFANAADCVQFGVSGTAITGVNLTVPSASPSLALNDTRITDADANFNAVGWAAGTTVTVALYRDDGWKTVNGQQGKTPVASYTVALPNLPYNFAQMFAGGTSTLAYAVADPSALTLNGSPSNPAAVAAVLRAGTAATLNGSWSNPAAFADGRLFRAAFISPYFEGPQVGNANNAANPRLQFSSTTYPGGTATTGVFDIAIRPTNMSIKEFSQFEVSHDDRRGARLRSRIVFQ